MEYPPKTENTKTGPGGLLPLPGRVVSYESSARAKAAVGPRWIHTDVRGALGLVIYDTDS